MSDSFVHLHVHTGTRCWTALPARRSVHRSGSAGNACDRHDRSRQRVRGLTTSTRRAEVRCQTDHRHRGGTTPRKSHTRAPYDFGNVPGDEVGEDGTPTMKGKQAYTHMTVLAETTEGMHNLFRLSSMASIEGYYRKPRFDRELLDRYGKGLIATTGCPSGEVNMCCGPGSTTAR